MVQQCITQIDSKELERLSIDTEKTIEMLQMEKIRRRRKHDKDVIINAVGHQRNNKSPKQKTQQKKTQKTKTKKTKQQTTKQTTNKQHCLLYTSPSPRDLSTSRMPSSA